jgi:hypothetical protein
MTARVTARGIALRTAHEKAQRKHQDQALVEVVLIVGRSVKSRFSPT